MSTDLLEGFGPYLLLRQLGRGGMGVVYVARSQDELHPLVAVKRMRADANVPSFRERFWHECELALRLRHPHIVEALEAGEIEGQHFVASALIHGQSAAAIAHRLDERAEGMPAPGVTRILADVLAALRYVHSATEADGRSLELVHRDVTPGNVLIGYDGRSYLADFGLARSLLTDPLGLTAEGTVLGTPRYMAPELVHGERATARSDLYAVGALAYTLLSGRGPYPGNPREVLTAMLAGPPVPLGQLRPDLPTPLLAFVDRLMARQPEDRAPTADVASAELDAVVQRARLGLRHAELGRWLSKLFAAERARTERQGERDLKAAPATPPARPGTRVLPAAEPPLDGDDRLPTFYPEASLGGTLLDDAAPITDRDVAPEPDTERGPGYVLPTHDPLGDLPTMTPEIDGPTLLPDETSAPPNDPAPQVSVRPATDAQPPRVTRGAPAQTPPPPRGRIAAILVLVAVIAAAAGALTVRMAAAPTDAPVAEVPEEVVALSERLGAAHARLRAAPPEVDDDLEAKLEEVRRAVRAGDVPRARDLLIEVERVLDRH